MGKIAFIFPGQGSQQVGMGRDMAKEYKKAAQLFREADDALSYPLSTLCFEGPEDKLQLTMNAQPAILTTSIACLRVFNEAGFKPDFVAGHSLGEYSALVASGSLSFYDAVKTVYLRGMFMEESIPAGIGAMLAVMNFDRNKLIEVCKEVSSKDYVVEPANFNSPGQIVISGHREAVMDAGKKLIQLGARRVIQLNVSGPFHSSLMEPAANRLKKVLDQVTILRANVPVITNVTGMSIKNSDEIRISLVKQVSGPVFWEDSIRYMLDQGTDIFIEIGTGNILSGLIKKINRDVKTLSVQDPETLSNTIKELEYAK